MTQPAVIVYSIFYVEPFVRIKMDHLYQMQHQIQAFFWEQVQTPVLQSWQSVPICDTGFPSQDPRNEKSASGPTCRQSWRKRGSPHWWRSPEGLRRQRWPQLGLDRGKRTLLWSPPRWSPANRSAWRHGEKWVCDTELSEMHNFEKRSPPCWWSGTSCTQLQPDRLVGLFPPPLLLTLCAHHPCHWDLFSHRGNTLDHHWSSATRIRTTG